MRRHIKNIHPAIYTSYFLLAACLLFHNLNLIGQGKNEEVTIIAPYIPSIGDATKIPFRPEITPAQQDTAILEFNYVTKRLETQIKLDPVEPMKYNQETKNELYRNYATVKLGNYATPYIDFMASSLQSEKYQFGARLKHHSSQGKIKGYPTSAYSHNMVSVFGRAFTKTHTFSANVGYNRDVVHFYGFAPDSFPDVEFTKDDIKQRFQHIHGELEFGSNYLDKTKIGHSFRLGINHYSDYYETKETQVSFLMKIDKGFEPVGNDFDHSMALDLGFDYFGFSDTLTSSDPLFFILRPVYRFGFSQYRFEAGLSIDLAFENTPYGSSFAIDVFPVLKAEVIIVEEKIKAFAEITGNRTINSFRSLTGTNPFLTSTPDVKYTDEQIKVGGGITGNAGGLNFLAGAYYSYLRDMPLFTTNTSVILENKFDVIYDNINLLIIKASMGYVKIDQLTARLLAAYYHYIPKNEEKAWHMPNFEIGLDAGYTFLEKYSARISVLALGSKYAKTYEAEKVVPFKINSAFDLGIGFDYRINRMITASADVNNILNQNYQRWYAYPVQGILVMAGVKLSF
jgi:hypothetical protein